MVFIQKTAIRYSSGDSARELESVPRREEGSTGKYQHEVEGTPETKCWCFPVLPDSSQGTDINQFVKVMKV